MNFDKYPRWLNNAFFEKVLRTSEGDKNFTILNFTLAHGSNNAEHYSSAILKAHVDFSCLYSKNASKDMIIKLLLPKNNALADEISFAAEINMYMNTVPDMERLLGSNFEILPKLLYCAKDPVSVVVLEDVGKADFEIGNKQLNLEDTKIVCSKIAKFHACSMSLNENNSKNIDNYTNGLFNLKSNDGLTFMKNNFALFIDELKVWKGCEMYVPKFENLHVNFVQNGVDIYQKNNEGIGYNVLNHGDFQNHNMLCKRENGRLVDVLFIDFQLSIFASPAIDIFYLLYMIASNDTRERHRTEILKYYFEVFQETATNIGGPSAPSPSLLDFNVELLKNGFLEIVIAVCLIPFFYAYQIQLNAGDIMGNDMYAINMRKRLYSLPDYRTMMEKLLPVFLHKGFLN